MIQKLVLCVAVITLISDSANGESFCSRIEIFSLLLVAVFDRGHPVSFYVCKIFPGFLFYSKFCLCVLGLIKRCYQCRSRGELGSCKDPFRYNASHVDTVHGVTAVPCASGWCGKVIEGETGAFREDGEL